MKSDLQGEGHAVYFQVDQGKKKKILACTYRRSLKANMVKR